MTEFSKHIEFYANYWFGDFSKIISEPNWSNKEIAKKYLESYWLSEKEYLDIWKPIQDQIFIEGKHLPDLIYKKDFEILGLRGGCLFLEDDFKQLQRAMQAINETYFVIVQHSQKFTTGEPMFRMKFPVNITWEELSGGNYISSVLLEMSLNEYYVFGLKGIWGKYAANDSHYPLDIIGFKPEISEIFKENFKQSKEDEDEIRDWLPAVYKDLIKKYN